MSNCKKSSTRVASSVIAVMMILQCFIVTAYADEMDGFTYTTDVNGVTITGYDNKDAVKLEIPRYLGSARVVTIAKGAFKGFLKLEEVKIPDTVKTISDNAFEECISLKEVTIPGSVERIGAMAFFSCEKLETVYILNGVRSIGDGAFGRCISLKKIAIAPSVDELDDTMIQDSTTAVIEANPESAAGQYKDYNQTEPAKDELPDNSPCAYEYVVDEKTGEVLVEGYVGTSTKPKIPNEINGNLVTGIGDDAFKDKPIVQVELPESLKTIGSNAFAGTGLTKVIIPDTVTGIGNGAFDNDANVTLIGSSDALDKFLDENSGISFIPYGAGRTLYYELSIKKDPDLGGKIVKGSSKDYKKGYKIAIQAVPESGYLFKGWTTSPEKYENDNIKDSKLSSTVLTMPTEKLTLTAKFEKLPDEVPFIIRNGAVHKYTHGNAQAVVPLEEASGGVNDYVNPKIPVTTLGINSNYSGANSNYYGYVFQSTPVEKVSISKNITNIHQNAFRGAYYLNEIEVAADNTAYKSIDGVLFTKDGKTLLTYPMNKKGESYTIPDGVETIAPYAFEGNVHLKTIIFANSIKNLGSYAFSGCCNLSEVDWKDTSFTAIPDGFFNDCGFSEITLPSGAATISAYAFSYCRNLTTVNLSDTITNFSSLATFGCYNVSAINVDDGNVIYSGLDGVMFNKDKTTLMIYPIAKTVAGDKYTVPETVKIIDSGAFGHAKFSEIDLQNVEEVRNDAFSYSLIKTADLSGVTKLGSSVFEWCTSLEKVILPELKNIPAYLFYGCVNLKNVNLLSDNLLSDKITSVGGGAFYYCTNLEISASPQNLVSVGYNAFAYCTKLSSIKVNTGSTIEVGAYLGCSSITEVDIPNDVTVGPNAFQNCTGIKTLVSKSNIAGEAFSGCSSLEKAEFSAANIGNKAFYGCISLNDIDLGTTITNIGASAFEGCSKLVTVNIPASVTAVGSRAFGAAAMLNAIKVDEANTNFKDIDGVLYDKAVETILRYPSAKEGTQFTPESTVKTVESYAFENAMNLKMLTFDTNIALVKGASLYGCNSLTEVKFYNKDTVFEYIDIAPYLNAFSGMSDAALQNLTVYGYLGSTAETLALITYSAKGVKFALIDEITEGLVFDKDGTLVGYSGTSTVIIVPNLVTKDMAGKVTVQGIDDLTKLENPIVIKAIGSNAFDGSSVQKSITNVRLPLSVKIIKMSAFEGCTGLSNEFKIPIGVEEIESYAFRECSSLTEITIPKNIRKIGENIRADELTDTNLHTSVFFGCTKLEKIKVDAENKTYSDIDGILTNKDKTKIYEAPNALFQITDGAIVIPESVESIGDSAFFGCKTDNGADAIVIPSGVVKVGINAFGGVFTRTGNKVEFKTSTDDLGNFHGVVDIDNEAFKDCTGIQIFNIPKTIERIGDDVFIGCTSLASIVVDNGSSEYFTEDGVLYAHSEDGSKVAHLVKYPKGKYGLEYTVDKVFHEQLTVVEICENAFGDVSSMQKVILKEGVSLIGARAFDNNGFKEVYIHNPSAEIKEQAFVNIDSLTIHSKMYKNADKDYSTPFLYIHDEAGIAVKDIKFVPFEVFYEITVNPAANGTITVNNKAIQLNGSPIIIKAEANEIITVIVTPDEGYLLKANSLMFNGKPISGNSFVMPAENVVITAEFEKIEKTPTVAPTDPNAGGSEDQDPVDGGIGDDGGF